MERRHGRLHTSHPQYLDQLLCAFSSPRQLRRRRPLRPDAEVVVWTAVETISLWAGATFRRRAWSPKPTPNVTAHPPAKHGTSSYRETKVKQQRLALALEQQRFEQKLLEPKLFGAKFAETFCLKVFFNIYISKKKVRV